MLVSPKAFAQLVSDTAIKIADQVTLYKNFYDYETIRKGDYQVATFQSKEINPEVSVLVPEYGIGISNKNKSLADQLLAETIEANDLPLK